MKKSVLKSFWFLNLVSWLVYYVAQCTTAPIFLTIIPTQRYVLIISFLFWITLATSLYRLIYKYFKFDEKSPIFIVIQSILSIFFILIFDIFARFKVNLLFIQYFFPTYYKDSADNAYGRVSLLLEKLPDGQIYFQAEFLNGQITKLMAIAVWVAVYNFYKFYVKAQNAKITRLQIENQLKESELVSLRSQLNPHFLFNALNSIHALTMSNPNKASEAVLLLSDLMRYALNYGKRDLVTIEEEVEMVRKYLELEKIRFGEKLKYEIDIHKDTLNEKIPPIVIQTLTENAIKHGVRQTMNGGFVSIKSFLKDNFLTIEIKNTGQLKNCPPSVPKVEDSGIGIENTIKRLKMLFGERAFFNIQNENEKAVVATVKIPISVA
ncbi:MAG: histidine kinase [Saprospiraceae bacterium]|nr:histidine kinase [Saprospiraceae bacterium]